MARSHPFRHAIITGGSSGIGYAIAHQLAHQGTCVSLIARGGDRLDAAASQIRQSLAPKATAAVFTYRADVSDRHQATQAVEEAIAQVGPPDVLITCAGMAYPDYFQALSPDIFEQTMAVNYFGSLYCIQAALPAMQTQEGHGHVCMVSSGAGLVGIYGYSAYSPSKFALRGLAETLRCEFKPLGIGVSIVYPPDTDTPQLAQENQTKPPITKAITASADLWQPDDVARKIITGIQRQHFAITPGLEMTVLARIHSVAAPLLHRYFDRIVTTVGR